MNLLNSFKVSLLTLVGFSLFSSAAAEKIDTPIPYEENNSHRMDVDHTGYGLWIGNDCQGRYAFGRSGFFEIEPENWFSINIPSYPNSTTVSINRNFGYSSGKVELNSTGLVIDKTGDYSITFSSILANQSSDEVLVTVFLVQNGQLDPTNVNSITGVAVASGNDITEVQGSAILKNIQEGTTLSLLITHGGRAKFYPFQVIGWDINASILSSHR